MNRNRLMYLHGIMLAVLLIAGCQGGVTPIKTLLDDPGRFDKQTVRIDGNVEEAAGALGYGAFRLNDGTGTLTVITKSEGAPRTGARVGVEGQFQSAFTFGTQSVAVVMESSRFTP